MRPHPELRLAGVNHFARRVLAFLGLFTVFLILFYAVAIDRTASAPTNRDRVLLQAFPAALNLTPVPSEEIVDNGDRCKNTKQGRKYIADENGQICARADLNLRTGCCGLPKQRSEAIQPCGFCDANRTCCTHFEACVACCLRDDNRDFVAHMIASGAESQVYETIRTPWQWCVARCRTSSASTIHGNRYRHRATPFCMGKASRSLTPNEADGSELIATVAEVDEDCNHVCDRLRFQCDPTLFKHINECDVLRRAFECTRCSKSYGYDQPAHVVRSQQHDNNTCLVNQFDRYFACNGHHPNTRRLCPCRSPE